MWQTIVSLVTSVFLLCVGVIAAFVIGLACIEGCYSDNHQHIVVFTMLTTFVVCLMFAFGVSLVLHRGSTQVGKAIFRLAHWWNFIPGFGVGYLVIGKSDWFAAVGVTTAAFWYFSISATYRFVGESRHWRDSSAQDQVLSYFALLLAPWVVNLVTAAHARSLAKKGHSD